MPVVRAAVLAALVVAGCGSGAGSAGSSPAATSTVDLPASYRFAPADITVRAGSTVTWTNHDHFSHTVQFLDGGLPTEPMPMDPNATVTFTFSAPGLIHYQCSLHPQNMKGTVLVTP
ncbi:MAG: plastocyanin/azurin family copper-binding protein [Chloroflexota bacterium]